MKEARQESAEWLARMNALASGLRQFRHLAEPRFYPLARWAVALPAFSPWLAKQPGYRPSQTIDNVRNKILPVKPPPAPRLLPCVPISRLLQKPVFPVYTEAGV